MHRRFVPAARGTTNALSPPTALAALSALAVLSAGSVTPAAAQPAAGQGAPAPREVTAAEARTDAYLNPVRDRPGPPRDFFVRLPKGGDLHNHLSGAVSAEYLIELAAEGGLCIDTATTTAVTPPCGPGTRPAADARTDRAFHDALVRAWSMEGFPPGQSGHDHFFATFGKFGEVTWRHRGRMLAEVADDVVRQNQFHPETMVTPASDGARRLADEVGRDDDLAALHRKPVAGGKLDEPVAEARKEAVGAARTERAGHGVDLVHEDDWQQTARTTAARRIAVEVPFTSNAQILGGKGADHPFTVYRRYGVPVVLATDDPGVSRTGISHEYAYAAAAYGLGCPG
ncbi:adenosine deaminase [Streptomyces sp. F-3]|nr:adenosine deaminase [Streptomyces sp. F-3]